MSDGPHRSLPLRRAWKKVCEIADGRAHALEEVVERIPAALAADAKGEISEGLLRSLRRILTSEQPQLIDDTLNDAFGQRLLAGGGAAFAGGLGYGDRLGRSGRRRPT